MATKTLHHDDIEITRTGRRAALKAIAAVGAALASTAALPAAAQEAEPLCSDSDPYDPGGYGRHCGRTGCSDSDPYDPGGAGRHCGSHGGRRHCSDSDPYDPGGHGRHC